MAPRTFAERYKIHRRAQRLLGVKRDAQDKYEFMIQCQQDMMDSGEAEDEGDARDICELLWNDEQDLYD